MCVAPQTAWVPVPAYAVVGRKPPWNQPQVTPRAFSRSPTFLPVRAARLFDDVRFLLEQSSYAGSGSLITVPTPFASGETTAYESLTVAPVFGSTACTPWVWPEIRLSAPGVDGPKTEPNELSDMA